MVLWARPSPSVPSTMASFGSGQGRSSSMLTERSLRGHGSRLEAQGVELSNAVFRPVGRAGADLRPGYLKHGAHAHAHGAAAERVAAGGSDEHGVHVQRGRAAEDRSHVGGIHDALQHRHPAGVPAQFFHGAGRGRRKAHSTPRVSSKPVSCASSSRSAVYTGASPQRVRISAAGPVICLRSISRERGCSRHPAPGRSPWGFRQ